MGRPIIIPPKIYHFNYALYIEMGEGIEHSLSINRRHFAWGSAGRIYEQLYHRYLHNNRYVRCF